MVEEREVLLRLSMKEIAIVCLACTELLIMTYANDRKDPVTGCPRSYNDLADLGGIVERLTVAIGEEPNIELRKILEQMRERDMKEEHPEGPFTAKQIIEWKNKAERGDEMNRVGIVKVNTLQGRAKLMAEADGLDPNDLVIFTVSMEKIIGDPVSYLLAQIEEDFQSSGEKANE